MNSDFNSISQIIKKRRTVKPDRMNGNLIEDEVIQELVALGDWAPTHAKTEPWRFVVYGPQQAKSFAITHAEMYKTFTGEAAFTQQKYNNLLNLGNGVSHIIIVWMKRISNHKIPESEEIAATACAIQNILLGATEKGIVCFWSTGGMAYHAAFSAMLNLGEEDKVVGILYMGYTDEPWPAGSRMIPLDEKIEWVK
jgi:nitroreductase